jgi:hypothetical protein
VCYCLNWCTSKRFYANKGCWWEILIMMITSSPTRGEFFKTRVGANMCVCRCQLAHRRQLSQMPLLRRRKLDA